VELMGGTIALLSESGHGTLFMVEVPWSKLRSSEVTAAEHWQELRYTLEPSQPEFRIPIVEDNPENAALLEQALTSAGFQVLMMGRAGSNNFRSGARNSSGWTCGCRGWVGRKRRGSFGSRGADGM
jgi:hypothetical protein